jgi:hypothetical protein
MTNFQPIGLRAEAPADEPELPCQQEWLDRMSDREFGALLREYVGWSECQALTDAVMEATRPDFERAMRRRIA